jgi:hypothetical protein
MASAGRRPARLGRTMPMPRVVVALGRSARGGTAYRVESPDRVLRLWALLNGAGNELHLQALPPESLARVQLMLQAVRAELERSVSPALAGELDQLLDFSGAEPDAAEVRIEYASLLGWVGGLVIGMLGQLEAAQHDPHMAGRSRAEFGAGETAPLSGQPGRGW